MKKIALIPPNGEFKSQDLFIERVANYLNENYSIELLTTSHEFSNNDYLEIRVTVLLDTLELINYLKANQFDLIIHRCWMHSYQYAALLSKEFTNICFYIKDWFLEISKEEYKFLYKTDEDYDSMAILLKSNNKILSHFNDKYIEDLSKHYKVNKNNFIFFPEYSEKKFYYIKKELEYNIDSLRLVSMGGIGPTCHPSKISNQYRSLQEIKYITAQEIYYDKMVFTKMYEEVLSSQLYLDYKFENQFNYYFNLVKGIKFDYTSTQNYHYGVYQILYTEGYNSSDSKATLNSLVSKFATYLEAGLPILVNADFTLVAELVKEYDIGIVVSNDEVLRLKQTLGISPQRYYRLVENVYKFRQNYTYNKKTMKPIMEMLK